MEVLVERFDDKNRDETIRKILNHFRLDVAGKNVYIKINAVDFRKGCYTTPETVGAVIDALHDAGARKIYVMENSTQGNFTRLVFKVTGIAEVIREKGARPLYLDEEKSVKICIGEFEVDFPRVIYRELITERRGVYINIPKLKTHDMTTVTLSLKNQFGFLYHHDRRVHHNKYELHKLIAAIYDLIKPDLAIIDGEWAVIHGHYPLEKFLERYLVRMCVYVASNNALAADIVAAGILCYSVAEVEHLRIADEKYNVSKELKILGDVPTTKEKFPHTPLGIYPEKVRIVEGRETCREGCRDNTLMVMEMLHVDYGGDGKFSVVFGKNIEENRLDKLAEPILVVGPCAIKEMGDRLNKFRKVVKIEYCNDLGAVTAALMKFMGLKATDLVPISTPELILTWLTAKLRDSKARTLPIF